MTVMVYWQAAHNTDYGKGRMRKGALLCSAVCCIDRVNVVKIVPLASFFHVDKRNSLYLHGLSYRILFMMKKGIWIIMLKFSMGQISSSEKACCSQDN